MIHSKHPFQRGYWIGLTGFFLGGIIGALSTYLIFASGMMDLIAGFISPDQPYVRFLFSIVLAFVGISLGGAIDGLVCGYTLHLIDPEGIKRRYLLGGAFSTGASQGILVIPIILFISLLSIYNVGSQADPASFILLFALVGGLFGFVNGGILSLSTLHLRCAWIAWLGYFIACVIGGGLFGLIIWRPEWLASAVSGGYATPLFLILAGALIYGAAGGMMGLVYTWLNQKRISVQDICIAPRLWQDITTVVIATGLFLATISLINRLATFVTIYQGNVTTSLSSKAVGVHWQESSPVSADILPQNGEILGLSAGQEQLVLVWSNSSGEILLSKKHHAEDTASRWSNPINVSISRMLDSVHPQTVVDESGQAHVVWSEDGQIWYNRCGEQSCGTPTRISTADETCNPGTSPADNDWPAIAIGLDRGILVAWDAGDGYIGYTTWDTSTGVDEHTSGCLESTLGSTRPRLAAGSTGEFWLASSSPSGSTGRVSLLKYSHGRWDASQVIGEGSSAEVHTSEKGALSLAWCGNNRELYFMAQGSSPQTLNSASCLNRPSMFDDAQGQLHLIFISDRWEDNFGNERIGKMLMESILIEQGWLQPAIVSPVFEGVQQEIANGPGGDAQLAWIDRNGERQVIRHSMQPVYHCDPDSLSKSMTLILNVIQNGSYHPTDFLPPFCGNHYEELVFLPYPFPEFAVLPAGEKDGFDQIASLIKQARYEVLFSMMQWDEDINNLSPGSRIAQAISEMYQSLKTNPAAYPRGLTIKILLGNYPNLSTLQMGDQIWNVLRDMTDMGNVPMQDPSIGWKVELANYKGSFPHSHTKFLVVDGKTLLAGGFNIAWTHLPKDDISGKGDEMTDLGITITGPVAQTGIEVFDEMWQGANQLICDDPLPNSLLGLRKACSWVIATVSHIPESLKYYLPGDTDAALGLYRTADYKESDEAMHAVLSSAQERIDIMHADFTAELICVVNLVFPGVCNFNNSLQFMRSLVSAIENNGAHVRVLVEETNMNGMENRVGLVILQDELVRRGLEDNLEIRFFNGRLHTKSILIDDQVLIIGSQNFHYSSISEGGLNEFNLVTDSPRAREDYQAMFDYYWQHAKPAINLQSGGYVFDW